MSTGSPSWSELCGRVQAVLAGGSRAAAIGDVAVEARWIVGAAAGLGPAELLARGGEPASNRAASRADTLAGRRATGEPLQYVLGSWSFRGLELLVDRRVLIPRPETEVTAGIAIDEAVRGGARPGRPRVVTGSSGILVADLGTGSGAIALALASELVDVEVWATDVSRDALAVARANLAGVGTAAVRVRLAEGSWYAALPGAERGRFAVIVANPPYVAATELAELPPVVRDHEPRAALVSGPTGLESIEAIVRGAPEWLAPNGSLVCELAPHQADPVRGLAREHGFDAVRVEPDLTGRPRVLVARLA